MTVDEMAELKMKYGDDLEVSKATHYHDEDEWNDYCLSYNGVIVGSELSSKESVIENISMISAFFIIQENAKTQKRSEV